MSTVESGEVYIWGSGSEGQLGLGADVVRQNQPATLPVDEKVVQVACGYYHTMLVTGLLKLHSIVMMHDVQHGILRMSKLMINSTIDLNMSQL